MKKTADSLSIRQTTICRVPKYGNRSKMVKSFIQMSGLAVDRNSAQQKRSGCIDMDSDRRAGRTKASHSVQVREICIPRSHVQDTVASGKGGYIRSGEAVQRVRITNLNAIESRTYIRRFTPVQNPDAWTIPIFHICR